MKTGIYLIIGLLFVSCIASTDKDKNEKVVKALLNDFITAIEEKNFGELDRVTNDDFVIYENGIVWNFEQFSNKLESYQNIDIKYKLKDIHFIVDKNTVHAQFHNQGTFTHPDTVIVLNFIESAAFVNDNNNWTIKFYHSTHLK